MTKTDKQTTAMPKIAYSIAAAHQKTRMVYREKAERKKERKRQGKR